MKWKDLDPESRETVQSWMFAEQLGIVNNETRTYTIEFYGILESMLPFIDPRLSDRERYEVVIMEFLRMRGQSVANIESLKALSLAAGLANQTINEKEKQGIPINEIIGFKIINDNDGINEQRGEQRI